MYLTTRKSRECVSRLLLYIPPGYTGSGCCCLLPIQPFANIIRDYACRDRKEKGYNKALQRFSPPFTAKGSAARIVYHSVAGETRKEEARDPVLFLREFSERRGSGRMIRLYDRRRKGMGLGVCAGGGEKRKKPARGTGLITESALECRTGQKSRAGNCSTASPASRRHSTAPESPGNGNLRRPCRRLRTGTVPDRGQSRG